MVQGARSVRAVALATCGELFRGLQLNVLLTLLISAAFGAVRVQSDGVLVVLPAETEYIWITGLIFGLIMGVLATLGTVKAFRAALTSASADAAALATSPATSQNPARCYRLLPRRTWSLTIAVCLVAMTVSAIAFPTILRTFQIERLNFAQVIVFITLYSWVLSKVFSHLLVKRMMLPDYLGALPCSEPRTNPWSGV